MAVPPTVPAVPASLYVGDLHHDVSDAQLFEAFSEFKSLASVRVCRDSATGRSLCYGYVNFVSPQDAIRAIEVKNHSKLNGKTIRVMWSYRDPDARRSGIGNVFVKNLSESIDNMKLQQMFQNFGNILSCKVVTSEDGKSKGYGFVQFEMADSAVAAIEKLNGLTVGGKQIYVGKFVKKSDRALSSPDAKYTNLYVKNLDPEISEEHLQEKFCEFGKIVSLVISKDENGASKGFGFINFENPDEARRAMEATNGLQLGSKILYVAKAQKKAEREQILRRQFEDKRKEQIMKYLGSNVYVKNIDDDVTDDELREHFRQCGRITSAKIMRDDKGMSKGFGFICFSTPEEANKAVNTLHGRMFRKKPLYVAIAQRKEERQALLQLQYSQHLPRLTGSSAVIAGGYPPLYYPVPGVIPAQPGVMYQHMGMRPAWRGNAFANSTIPAFQPSSVPLIPSAPRPNRQNRGRMNRNALPQAGGHPFSYGSHLQRPLPTEESSNQQHNGQVKYVPNGRVRDIKKGPAVSPVVPTVVELGAEGPEMLSSMLAAASPQQQKQILGERLYPLVSKHKGDLAAKITGMLLEMDNSELLLLLESPQSLATKVEEAIQVLEMSKAKVSSAQKDAALHQTYLSAGVAVN